MRPYSRDPRPRVLAAADRGMPRREIAEVFGVSEPTVRRYPRPRRETGAVEPSTVPGPPQGGPGLGGLPAGPAGTNPDPTLAEHRELFGEEHGVGVRTATMSRAFRRPGLALKKSRPWRPSATRGRSGASG